MGREHLRTDHRARDVVNGMMSRRWIDAEHLRVLAAALNTTVEQLEAQGAADTATRARAKTARKALRVKIQAMRETIYRVA